MLWARSPRFTDRHHCRLDTIAVSSLRLDFYSALPSIGGALRPCRTWLLIAHAAFGGPGARQAGSHTPRTLNSLSAIAGHEGDEDEWEHEMQRLRNEDEVRWRSLQHAIVFDPTAFHPLCSTQACPFPTTATALRTHRLRHHRFLPTTPVDFPMFRLRLRGPRALAAFVGISPSTTRRVPLACGDWRLA